MQTFLPLPNYLESMRCLDKYRLGNQVWREGITLIRGGWPHHPASKMWKGHEYHLGVYLLAGIRVLKERGKDYSHIGVKILDEMWKYEDTGAPSWLGDEKFHASHRSNLLRKVIEAEERARTNPTKRNKNTALYVYAWYNQFGWNEPPNLPYVWPTA